MINPPLISVILPVYNGALYLREAIESILNQTYTNFEFIIINDGSKDNSEEIIKSYNDNRIIYISQKNIGLAATLNIGIKISKGKYIARMDQDDISLPERFEKQIDFLEKNKDYDILGTWAKIFPDKTNKRFHKHPTDNIKLKYFLLFNNPFVHSSVMIRKSVFEKIGLYSEDKNRQPPEDYELWSRIARVSKIANIPEVLLNYREVSTGMSNDKLNPFLEKVKIISLENISYYCNKKIDIELIKEVVEIYNYGNKKPIFEFKKYIGLIEIVVESILKKNDNDKKSSLKEEKNNTLKRVYLNYIKRKNNNIIYILKRIIFKLIKIKI